MAIVNMTEAAKLSGTNRTTLWRKAKAGVLSTTTFPDGAPGIDTAELFRVFPPEQTATAPVQHNAARFERLEHEIEHLHSLLQLKDQVIETQAQALRLLEHRPTVEPAAIPAEIPAAILEAERTRSKELEAQLDAERSRGFFSRLFGGKR